MKTLTVDTTKETQSLSLMQAIVNFAKGLASINNYGISNNNNCEAKPMNNTISPYVPAWYTEKNIWKYADSQSIQKYIDTITTRKAEYLLSLYMNLDEEGLELVHRARIWHMPIKEYHLLDTRKLRHEIENYEKLLDEASTLWIGWETDTYDIEGLIEAIAEASGVAEEDYRGYRNEVNAVYRAGRGV